MVSGNVLGDSRCVMDLDARVTVWSFIYIGSGF